MGIFYDYNHKGPVKVVCPGAVLSPCGLVCSIRCMIACSFWSAICRIIYNNPINFSYRTLKHDTYRSWMAPFPVPISIPHRERFALYKICSVDCTEDFGFVCV